MGEGGFSPHPLQCHLYRLHWPFLLASRASLGHLLLQPCTYHSLYLGMLAHLWRTSPLDTVALGLLTDEFSNSVTHSLVSTLSSFIRIDHFFTQRGNIWPASIHL